MVPWRGAGAVAAASAWRSPGRHARRARSCAQCDADAVVAMGGYPSPADGARRRGDVGIPVVIHESGATGGRANRLAARFTPNVAAVVRVGRCVVPGRTARVVGMPLRPRSPHSIRDLRATRRNTASPAADHGVHHRRLAG